MKGNSNTEEEAPRLVTSQPCYGTFQGNLNYSHQTVIGIPQPAIPPGAPAAEAQYAHGYQAVPAHGYQAVPGYSGYQTYPTVIVVEERTSRRRRRLPCCGIGIGWALFICGFFLGTLPWYVGAFILMCVPQQDDREKPGLLACVIAAILSAIAITIGATKGVDVW